MTNCELCGNKHATLHAEVEGTIMNVCKDCSRFGKVTGGDVKYVVKEKRSDDKEPTFIFVKGYGAMLKNARERMGLKQEEFAKKLNEKESVLHQIESEHFKPSVELARKLERTLHIKIIEEVKDEELKKSERPKASGPVTIGDLINIRK